MNKTQLQQVFETADADKDGRITLHQFLQVLKTLGRSDVYGPSLKKDIQLLNYEEPSIQTINFKQFYEYVTKTKTKLRKQFWKSQYGIMALIKDIQMSVKGRDLKTIRDRQLQGKITVIVGPKQQYSTELQLEVIKSLKKKIVDPSITIRLHTKSQEDAIKLQEILKVTVEKLKELINGSDPQLSQDLDLINVVTKREEKKVDIQIQCKIEDVFQFQETFSNMIDDILSNKVEGRLKFTYKTSNNILKFFKPDQVVNVFEYGTKNSFLEFEWSTNEITSAIKEVLLGLNALSDLEYQRMHPFCLLLLGFFNSENLKAVFEFDNLEKKQENELQEFEQSDLQRQSQEIRGNAMQFVTMGVGMTSDQSLDELKISDILRLIYQRIEIDVNLGSYDAKLKVNINGLNQIINMLLNQGPVDYDDD